MRKREIPSSTKEALIYWLQNSSIDGFGHVGRARNPATRFLWVLVLIGGVIATIFHLYWIVHEFYQRDVRSTILLSPTSEVRHLNKVIIFNAKKVLVNFSQL